MAEIRSARGKGTKAINKAFLPPALKTGKGDEEDEEKGNYLIISPLLPAPLLPFDFAHGTPASSLLPSQNSLNN